MKDRIAERLREVAMPPEEIRAVLTTDDDKLVHRYIELHRERLAEELQARSRSLDTVERALTAADARRR